MKDTALFLDLDSYTDKNYATHGFHPYPAKFVPQIPKELLLRYSDPGAFVLDPFCGSGTTLVEAMLNGRDCVGTDVNDLAVLISRAKTIALDESQIEKALAVARNVQQLFEKRREPRIAAPPIKNVEKWFSDAMQLELRLIKETVWAVEDSDVLTFLKTAFAYAVGKASNQESDTVYRSIAKNLADGHAIAAFQVRVQDMAQRMKEYGTSLERQKCDIQKVDITTGPFRTERQVDLVVTSPPYLNSYDYYLYHKHRMAWLDIDHVPVQEQEFGSRNKHNDHGLEAAHYEGSIERHLKVIAPSLADSAIYACVVGDGIVRGTLYRADELFDAIFERAGFRRLDGFRFDQRKYTRAFTKNLRTAHKETHVLVYQRT